ncbi:putative ubiquitin-specific processing protease 21 [Rhizophagus clarus]|uniref:ubiquitinyl hydrolase 1 n=1 Tax=Rhizophagus clarus TaxID=94130 RepID=A0A8H3QTY7_9GLOM|nr:putative ubiquitin-specific processing protease 21 [Rhizophagus clarus]
MTGRCSELVAIHLNTDPLKLRSTSAFLTSGIHKCGNTTLTLSEILQTSLSAHILFYEILNAELETKKSFKVVWLGNIVKRRKYLDENVINQYNRIIQVCHFTNDPIHFHGIPFEFVIKNGEKLANPKIRFQQRLGMSEKDFHKLKFQLCQKHWTSSQIA